MRNLLIGVAAALALASTSARADTPSTDTPAMTPGSIIGTVKGVDASKNMVTIQLPLAPGAAIMRAGHSVSLDSVKQGEDVRASFDPTTNTITRINIEPKGTNNMNPHMNE